MNGYKTYIGIVVSLLPTVLGVLGYHLAPGADVQVNAFLSDLVTILGGALAFYGRAKAEIPGFLVKNTTPPSATPAA